MANLLWIPLELVICDLINAFVRKSSMSDETSCGSRLQMGCWDDIALSLERSEVRCYRSMVVLSTRYLRAASCCYANS